MAADTYVTNAFQANHSNDTDILYGVVRNVAKEIRDVVNGNFEAHPASGSLDDYDISAGVASGGLWSGSFPVEVANGAYIYQVRIRAGATPDFADEIGAVSKGYWNGVAFAEVDADKITDAVWDEVLTGATHNVATSAGRRLRQVEDMTLIEEGTCQVASDASHVKLAAGASAVNNWYDHVIVIITENTGAGQARCMDSYNGTSKEGVVHPDWLVEPDATSKYTLYTFVEVHVNEIQGTAQQDVRDSMKLAPTSNSPAAGSVDKHLDDIVEDTNELQTDDMPTTIAAVDAKVVVADAVVDAIKLKTDNLPGSPAAIGSPMTLENDSITAGKFDESSAFPVKSTDTGDTTLARKGSGAETLTTVKAATQSGKLAADGLDAISTTEPAALTGINFRERVLAVYRFFFGKTTHTISAPGQGEFEQFKENGVAVLLKQATSDDGTTQTKGEAAEP